MGGGGATKVDERVRRGKGGGGPFPNHLDLLFQNRGVKVGELEEGRGEKTGREGVTPSVSLVNPKGETLSDLPPLRVTLNHEYGQVPLIKLKSGISQAP